MSVGGLFSLRATEDVCPYTVAAKIYFHFVGDDAHIVPFYITKNHCFFGLMWASAPTM